MNRALLWKEWREQRWRGALSVLVLVTLAASLVRAQLMSLPEATLFVFWPIGLLLAIFLAMGSVATERADNTWPFLRAQPIGPARILRLKWLAGAILLIAAFVAAGAAAHVAAWSRGLFDLPLPPPEFARDYQTAFGMSTSAWVMWRFIGATLIAMLAWYTVLFFILTRARTELHAGLGGILLTIAAVVWAFQYAVAPERTGIARHVLQISGLLNPLSPAAASFSDPGMWALAIAIAVGLWILGPLWLVGRLERRGKLS